MSPAGNLYASTLVRLRPSDPPAATLALVAAVALEEAVRSVVASAAADGDERRAAKVAGLQLKWPNDLLLDGAKLSGILLERGGVAIVIGIGVNCAHHPDLAERATTSLAAHGVAIRSEALLERLVAVFGDWLARWRGEGMAAVRAAWLAHAHPLGTPLSARLPDGTTLDGRFDGLGPYGALQLRLAGGEQRVIHAADIFLI